MAAVLTPHNEAFMSVKQVAAYLQLNEKKIYALVNEGRIPATKVTGKWMFPRELVDRWMIDSAHGGLLADRLAIAGSDDPLLFRIVTAFARDASAMAQISYTPTGTRLGLELLQANRIDVSALRWGPAAESRTRHPALLRQHAQYRNWVLIRAFSREQGLLMRPQTARLYGSLEDVINADLRWVERQPGTGANRFVMEVRNTRAPTRMFKSSTQALSEREAAGALVLDQADVSPGSRATASEAGLTFLPCGIEDFDLVLPRNIWFRRMFQDLIGRLRSGECRQIADLLGGYDFTDSGEMVWGDD